MNAGTNEVPLTSPDHLAFQEAVQGLIRGDFSRLEPLFVEEPPGHQQECRIVEWHKKRYFESEPKALAEALSCACFLGRKEVAKYLFSAGRSYRGRERHGTERLSLGCESRTVGDRHASHRAQSTA